MLGHPRCAQCRRGRAAAVPEPRRGAGACASGGWYYDDPDEPSEMILCPDTCTEINAGTDPAVQLEVGCKTQTVAIL
jgi:hypothetical protein